MVLVVDDFPEICEILQRMLRHNGLQALSAHDVEEAETILQQHRPEVVVLDNAMPGRSGLDLLRQIKSDPSLASIPILMFSALEDAGLAERARLLGAAGWLVKANTSWLHLIENIARLHGSS